MKSLISFQKMSFAYLNPDAPENPEERSREDLNLVFDGFDLELPPGIVSVLGENGIGKSTLLLLAGARFFPHRGKVTIDGIDTEKFKDALRNPELEEQRSRLVSFVYQNMEFETEEAIGELLERVKEAGSWADRPVDGRRHLDSMEKALELEDLLGKKPQFLSKGELQRFIIGLSLCYGSRIIMMDEPVFALEERQKEAAFAYLGEFCRTTGTSLYYTAHDINLCRDYADTTLLLSKDKSYLLGPAAEVCSRENLEKAYKTPMSLLYHKDTLYRDMLLKGKKPEA